MWLFTKHGFITAVNARVVPDRKSEADPDKIIIRTRVRSHMENLVKAFPILSSYEIDDRESGRDYQFIMIVPKTVWVEVVSGLAEEMDYPKFKSSIVEFPGKEVYHDACLDIWNYMYSFHDEHVTS